MPTPDVRVNLQAVAASSARNAWAVGGATTLRWNGRAWRMIPSPAPGRWMDLADVAHIPGTRPSQFWAVGSYADANGQHALIQRWTGHRWVVVRTPAPAQTWLTGVIAFGRANAWAVGGGWTPNVDDVPYPLAMHWNGRRWSLSRVPPASPGDPSGELKALAGTAPRDLWAVGISPWHVAMDGGGLFSLHRTATGWTATPNPLPLIHEPLSILSDVVVLSRSNVWAVGWTIDRAYPLGWLVTQHWNGVSWEDVPVAQPAGRPYDALDLLRGVAAVSASDIWAVGSSWSDAGGRYPLILRWNGSEWRLKDLRGRLHGITGELNAITRVPGTRRQMWAVGHSDTPNFASTILRRC